MALGHGGSHILKHRYLVRFRPMRFAFVITQSDSIGGSNVHVRDLATALMRDGHEVKVFVGGEGPFTLQLKDLGIPYQIVTNLVHPIDLVCDFKCIFELKNLFKEFKPDLISTHSSKAGQSGRFGGKLAGIPAIFTAHGWLFVDGVSPRRQQVAKIMETLAGKVAAKVITVCDDDRRIAIEKRVLPAGKVITIHNGMPDYPDRANPAAEPVRFVMVARIEYQKDHETLFRALAKVKDRAWGLDLVGDGPRRAEMEALTTELGIADRVKFHGAQRNVRDYLAGAQTFVLVTHYEGFPRSTVEAMRTGLPVIVTDVNGCKEALEEGVTGFSVPVHDVDALALTLAKVIDDPELRRKMGEAGRKRYEAQFTFDQMFAKTKAVYAEVLGKPIEVKG